MNSFEDLEAGHAFTSRRSDGKNKIPLAYGVFEINTAVSKFQRLVDSLGTSKDTSQHREELRTTRLRIAQLVKDTAAKLKQASDTDQQRAEACKIAKHAKDFESVLQKFQQAQRISAAMGVQFVPESSYTPSEELERSSETKSANHIIDVNEIFKDLDVLVHEQGDCIVDIDSHVQKSKIDFQQGKDELEKADKTQKSKSSLTCLLCVIFGLVLFIAIIILTS
ncbi:hypothetical protein MKW94_028888 [Papaver nudicaule]|uniref:t-SNARE coiled-coil homology domain-containing protein n=1 Tax=Papaver nudicaule TaxID=74823 RepID=A0AA41SC21_PAPNU|nr:hypothetical protein [Papaver nudicaule]